MLVTKLVIYSQNENIIFLKPHCFSSWAESASSLVVLYVKSEATSRLFQNP